MRLTDGQHFVVGVTAGSGAVATISAHAGADFLLAINAARLRNMGAPSIACMLPFLDASRLVDQYADVELLSQVTIPTLLGVNCWREDFDARRMSEAVLARGFAGVVNFPPSSLYPDAIQRRLESAGVGFSAELAMLRDAQDTGCIALAYCRTISQGREAALIGLDNILLNFGWNSGGWLSPSSENTLDEAATIAASFVRQIRRIRRDTCLLLEGGPVESESDLEVVLRQADLNGYIGGSTFERVPVERSIADRIASFKMAKARLSRTRPSDRQLVAFGRRAGFVGSDPALTAALAQLQAVRQARPHFSSVLVPTGEDMAPPINALTRSSHGGRPYRVVDVSCRDLPDPAKRLFGDGQVVGICFDRQTDVVVLRHVENLTALIQDQLAAHIAAQGAARQAQFPRLILVGHEPPEGLHPPLARLVAATQIALPPLRARPNDLEDLLKAAMHNLGHTQDAAPRAFSPAALLRLRSYDWPGNTAELVALCGGLARSVSRKAVSLDDVDTYLSARSKTAVMPKNPDTDRRQMIVDALKRNGFRKGRAALALGISRKTLYNWMKREGLS